MSATTIEIARYHLKLTMPMWFDGREFRERAGFFVRLDGQFVGEVAPMPGQADVGGCIRQLKEIGIADVDRLSPALAWGVSCALALRDGDPVLTKPLRRDVGVNHLHITGADDRCEHRTIKVKVGADNIQDDRRLIEQLPARAKLRLDGNRRFTLDKMQRLLNVIDRSRVEYVEEPLVHAWELPMLHHHTGCPIALDESLHDADLRAALEFAPGVTTHVLKPTLVGSLTRVRERAERTARQELRTTVTTSVETSYSVRLLARLITWLPNADGDHGLDTARLLADDPIAPPKITNDTIDTSEPLPEVPLPFVPLEACDGG